MKKTGAKEPAGEGASLVSGDAGHEHGHGLRHGWSPFLRR